MYMPVNQTISYEILIMETIKKIQYNRGKNHKY